MKSANDKFGAVAIQQALVKHFGHTIRRAAGFAQVHPRTLHGHVQAKFGSKVTAWENRTVLAQSGAIEAARALIIANQQLLKPLPADAQKFSDDLAELFGCDSPRIW